MSNEKIADPDNVLRVAGDKSNNREDIVARIAAGPYLASATVLTNAAGTSLSDLKIKNVIKALKEKASTIRGGNLGEVEELLFAQASALNSLFEMMTTRSMQNMGKHLEAMEVYMRMALRAQNQCRATLETLANVKNPSIVYARQANITSGPQQINNAVPARHAHADENKILQNKQMEQHHVERMDTGTEGDAVGGDQTVATLVAVNRSKDG